jgi:heparanase
MSSKLTLLSSLLLSSLLLAISASPSLAENVTVIVRVATAIQETDENLVCATIDWWPKDKCDYSWCPWYNSSILNLVS